MCLSKTRFSCMFHVFKYMICSYRNVGILLAKEGDMIHNSMYDIYN